MMKQLTVNSNSIDLMKFVFSLCVVTIHCNVVGLIKVSEIQDLVYPLLNEAVPFFFTVSAFFTLRKLVNPNRGGYYAVFQYIKRISRIYLFWSLYLIAISMMIKGVDYIPINGLFRNFFFKGFDVLWYMWGLIIVIPLFSLLVKMVKSPWFYLFLSFGALIMQKVVTHYGYQPQLPFYLEWVRYFYDLRDEFGIEWILKSITYISIGTMFVFSKLKITTPQSILLIVAGIVLMHFETNKDVALGLPLIAIGSFPLIADWKVNITEPVSLVLRRMSSLIYFIHVSVIMLYRDLLEREMDMTTWLLVLMTCVVVSLPICIVAERYRNKWICQFI